VLFFASSALPNVALMYVEYPAKVVSKMAGLVPTMIVSLLMGNSSKFGGADYASAVLLVCGAVTFALNSYRDTASSEVSHLRMNFD
jgi:hypothetical protein